MKKYANKISLLDATWCSFILSFYGFQISYMFARLWNISSGESTINLMMGGYLFSCFEDKKALNLLVEEERFYALSKTQD